LFKGAWKIGVAFAIYTEDSLSYCYYPIRRGTNDLLVRRISPEIFKQLPHDRTIHPFDNPIQADPVSFAREYVEQQIVELLHEKAFRFDDLILSRELLFSVADALSAQLGLRVVRGSIGQRLSLKTFAYGWMHYLPHWVNYAAQTIPEDILNNLRSVGSLHGYVDLGSLEFSLACTGKRPHDIRAGVRAQISEETPVSIPFSVDKQDLPLYQVSQVLDSLLGRDLKELERLYTSFDYSRLSGKAGLLSNYWTYDQCLENLRLFYRELPRIFEHVVQMNFGAHRHELHYFNDFDRRIMILSGNGSAGYHLSFCDLRSKDVEPANRIDLYAEQDGVELPGIDQRSAIFDGSHYEIVQAGSINPSFIFRPLPLLNEVSDELSRRIRELPLFARTERPPSAEIVMGPGGKPIVRAATQGRTNGSERASSDERTGTGSFDEGKLRPGPGPRKQRPPTKPRRTGRR